MKAKELTEFERAVTLFFRIDLRVGADMLNSGIKWRLTLANIFVSITLKYKQRSDRIIENKANSKWPANHKKGSEVSLAKS